LPLSGGCSTRAPTTDCGATEKELNKEDLMTAHRPQAVRLRIYLGEDKTSGDQPLYHSIISQARIMHLAGATVLKGTEGFGRSTRLHTTDVLFSVDLPVVIEIIDLREKIEPLIAMLNNYNDVGLITCEPVELRGRRYLAHGTKSRASQP
jgi:uncharacterized protein